MQLLRARVANFKNIEDSGWVSFDNVTCLVGKNESGKTAFLQGLQKLSAAGGASGDLRLLEYPRKSLVKYRRTHKKRPARAVSAEFELSHEEARQIEEAFGTGILRSRTVTAHKNYANEVRWDISLAPGPTGLAERISEEFLAEFLPGIVYFHDFSLLPGRISIPEFVRRVAAGQLDDADLTFLALLRLASVPLSSLENLSDYESLKTELETASASITDEVLKYWSQNRQLRVEFDLMGTDLYVRIRNKRHRVSVPFDERSRGFVWFFSFLARFSQIEAEQGDFIFLLDEPGLNLHAQAQKDFLRFIDEHLSLQHTVIYSTHSPFLIHPGRLDRVRLVEDADGKGTRVTTGADGGALDARVPIQAAVGLEWARSVTANACSLLVESPSDLIYLQVLSDVTAARGKASLDPRWEIVPVGSIGNLASFAEFLGARHPGIAEIEDLFDARFFGRLAAEANAGQPFSRYRTAAYLLRNLDRFLEDLESATTDRAAALFQKINEQLPPGESDPSRSLETAGIRLE